MSERGRNPDPRKVRKCTKEGSYKLHTLDKTLSLGEDWCWWSSVNTDAVNILLSTRTCAGWSSHPPMKACLAEIRLAPGAFYCLADLGRPIPLRDTSSFLTGRAGTWNTSNGSGWARCSERMQTSLFFHHLYSVGDDQTSWQRSAPSVRLRGVRRTVKSCSRLLPREFSPIPGKSKNFHEY